MFSSTLHVVLYDIARHARGVTHVPLFLPSSINEVQAQSVLNGFSNLIASSQKSNNDHREEASYSPQILDDNNAQNWPIMVELWHLWSNT